MDVLIIGGKGYCGSFLARGLIEHKITVLDLKDGIDYKDFYSYSLDSFDAILWFAGKSSVKAAERDSIGALNDNCIGLSKLLEICGEKKKYLIYASSASVYSNNFSSDSLESKESDPICPGFNAYDRSKFVLDYIAKGFFFNFLSLRLGTVCGFSDPLRADTVFNSMNLSALRDKKIHLSNPDSFRSILFLDDLLEIVKMALYMRPKGILNTASQNIKIGNIAQTVKDYYKVPIIPFNAPKGYSFSLDLFRLKSLISLPEVSLIDRCKEFERQWKLQNA